MRKEIIIHIGMGKTGTTALQHFFWANRDALRARGISYPEYGSVSNAHHLLSPHVPDFLQNDWEFLDIDTWGPVVRQFDEARVLLSSELFAWAKVDVVNDFLPRLLNYFEPRIVMYVRRQDEILMATYSQQVKAGTLKLGIKQFSANQLERFDYYARIAPWADALGDDRIIVRPYEVGQFYEGDIRKDFLKSVLGIDIDSSFVFDDQPHNQRPSPAVIEYKRLINILEEDQYTKEAYNKALLDFVPPCESKLKNVLSPDERAEIIGRLSESNSRLAKRYLHRDDGRLFLSALEDGDLRFKSERITRDDGCAITRHLMEEFPPLYDHLCKLVAEGFESQQKIKSQAAGKMDVFLQL